MDNSPSQPTPPGSVPGPRSVFGERRTAYINFAAHLLNAYNPNVLYPDLPHRWSDEDWRRFIDMIASFGLNGFEFWLVPRLFCREGIASDFGQDFIRQANLIVRHAHKRGVRVTLLAALTTVGAEWRTLCPNEPDEWREVRHLWDAWTKAIPELDIVSIFPGDPGGCSRNGCTAETYIDRAAEIGHLVRQNLPHAEIELGTWGPPFFAWGNIQGPDDWKGEFISEYQHTAWAFDADRAKRSMEHLLARLPDFPSDTSVAINLGFNGDGNPDGEQNATDWVNEIAKTHPVQTWDFSLTEGENNIVPHYRFERLFDRRRLERSSAPYRGGICFTMTPLLNQLSLFESAQSFLNPNANPDVLAADFCASLFGPVGRELTPYLKLFEVVRDWGNYHPVEMPRAAYHKRLNELVDLLRDLRGAEREDVPFLPGVGLWREELLFFARLFADFSAPAPDYDELVERFRSRVYGIYDHLPDHVDPRPRLATEALVRAFRDDFPHEGPIAGKWTD